MQNIQQTVSSATGYSTNQTSANNSVILQRNQFCAIALINNLNYDIAYTLTDLNNATMMQRLLDSNFTVDFTNDLVYETQSYQPVNAGQNQLGFSN